MTGDSEECKLKHKELTFVSDILLKLNNEHLALLRYRKRTWSITYQCILKPQAVKIWFCRKR